MRRAWMSSRAGVFIAAVAVAFGVLGPGPASAQAAPTKVSFGEFEFSGVLDVVAGKDTAGHRVTISYSPGAYVISDPGGVAPELPCTAVTATAASCPSAQVVDAITFDGSAGPDRLDITSVGPELNQPSGNQTGLFGNGGDDTMTVSSPTPTRDLMSGGDGDDTFDGGPGSDSFLGRRGIDTTSYAGRSEAIFVKLDDDPEAKFVPDGANGGKEGDEVVTERVIGGDGDDVIIGWRESIFLQETAAQNLFTGGPGNDRLVGEAGADKLNGGPGKDTLLGGPQKDTLLGGAGRDRCVGGPSKDVAKRCEVKRSLR